MKRKEKQTQRVLEYMQTHDGITTEEAVVALNIWSLARRIKDLREQGHRIETVWVKHPEGYRYGIYKLKED